jgi:hypothetical protein
MTALAHRSMPGVAQRLGRVTRMSPAAAHAIGCVLAFTAVACGVIYLMDAADASGLHRSRALLATAHARVAAARRMLPTAAAQQRDRGSAALRDPTRQPHRRGPRCWNWRTWPARAACGSCRSSRAAPTRRRRKAGEPFEWSRKAVSRRCCG